MDKTGKLKLSAQKAAPRRPLWLAQALLALVVLYALGLKAIDTGKLQYYFLVLVLLGFAVNRLAKTGRRRHA